MYAIIIILFILSILMLYCAYNVKKGVSSIASLLSIIKFFLDLLNPILFAPIFDLFLTIFRCTNGEGGTYHDYWPDV